jgi:hypothetical protein
MASPPPPRPIDAPAPVSPTFDAFWARQRPDPPRLRAPGRVDERHFASTLPPVGFHPSSATLYFFTPARRHSQTSRYIPIQTCLTTGPMFHLP